jgi:hypothetical protein
MQALNLYGTNHPVFHKGNVTLLIEDTNTAKQNREQTDILTKKDGN